MCVQHFADAPKKRPDSLSLSLVATIAQFEQVARASSGMGPGNRPSIHRAKKDGRTAAAVTSSMCSMTPLHHVERAERDEIAEYVLQAGGRVGVAVRQLPDQIGQGMLGTDPQ